MVKKKYSVTIVIPAKNEGEGLRSIIRSVRKYADECIVVDGHSLDMTQKIAKEEGIRYLLDHGSGRGDGVRMGLAAARGSVAVLFDADGSHESRDIPRILKPIQSGVADLVIGSRRTGGSFDRAMDLDSLIRSLGSDILTMMVNKKFDTALTDILYSFRAIRTASVPLLRLRSNGFTIEQEMVVSALQSGLRISEIPSREKARGWGKTKLKTIAGLGLFVDLVSRL